jgi:hypothetical protein
MIYRFKIKSTHSHEQMPAQIIIKNKSKIQQSENVGVREVESRLFRHVLLLLYPKIQLSHPFEKGIRFRK